ncbi:MAG: lysophospholipid acyltransferase family protein [Candidatus Rokubacteria bacterium]|nr:lysophospholipid acyltransferase family protein [Candidatus Rokubacteria bacterium]
MRVPASLSLAVGPALGAVAIRLLARTITVRREEGAVAAIWAGGAPLIFTVWHSRILLLPYLYRGHRLRVLASRSRDGEIIARLMARFGLETVRGSSSRGGAAALRELLRSLRAGWGVVVVPDGPRGPREVVKPGIVTLAALSGAAVVPLAVAASSDWRMPSWDELRIPRPFSRCVVRFGEPIRIARRCGRDAQEGARKEIEAALRAVTWQADDEAAA